MIEPFTYTLKLSTNETIHVVEVYLPLIPEPVKSWMRGRPKELTKATYASKPAVEAAKLGYDKDLLQSLNSAPPIVLMRMPLQVCSQIKKCASANPDRCRLSRTKRSKPDFPPCFDYDLNEPEIKSVMNLLISYLSENFYLIISDD